ncbi:MAG: 6-phosphogluconolactonase [Ferruginibacter sp.]
MAEIFVFKDEQELQKAVAEKIIALAANYIKINGRFTLALSGGNTPSGLYALLATESYITQVNWKKVFIFWGDERMVPMDDKENNSYNAKKVFLDKINIPGENIFRINTTLVPANTAMKYEKIIKEFFHESIPAIDLILLGLGTNGHTASLFPGTEILHERNALVKDVYLEDQQTYRVSFTIPLINNASNIFFLVTGKDKSSIVKKVLQSSHVPLEIPAQFITSKNNNLYWYLDEQAASDLKN